MVKHTTNLEKVDLRKVNFNKSATWNIFYQYGIDIETKTKKPLYVDDFYMPQKEQDKLVNYLLKNYKKLKEYKCYKTKKAIRKQLSYEILGYFPSTVKR